jgi:hypothetical protein
VHEPAPLHVAPAPVAVEVATFEIPEFLPLVDEPVAARVIEDEQPPAVEGPVDDVAVDDALLAPPPRTRHRRAASQPKVDLDLRAFLPADAPTPKPLPVAPEPVVAPDGDAPSAPLLERIAAMEAQERLALVPEPEMRESGEPWVTEPFVDRRNPVADTIEHYTLAVAREPVREIDPQIEAALDDLARTAREEILSRNAPKRARRQEEDTPWLAPIRKAWEPPEPEPQVRPRWGFRRRVG